MSTSLDVTLVLSTGSALLSRGLSRMNTNDMFYRPDSNGAPQPGSITSLNSQRSRAQMYRGNSLDAFASLACELDGADQLDEFNGADQLVGASLSSSSSSSALHLLHGDPGYGGRNVSSESVSSGVTAAALKEGKGKTRYKQPGQTRYKQPAKRAKISASASSSTAATTTTTTTTSSAPQPRKRRKPSAKSKAPKSKGGAMTCECGCKQSFNGTYYIVYKYLSPENIRYKNRKKPRHVYEITKPRPPGEKGRRIPVPGGWAYCLADAVERRTNWDGSKPFQYKYEATEASAAAYAAATAAAAVQAFAC